MMNERELSAALHGLGDRDALGVPPIERLLERGHRSRRVRTAAGGVTALVIAGLLVAGVTVFPRPGASPPGDLVYAGAHPTTDSYHFRTYETALAAGGATIEYRLEGDSDPQNQHAVYGSYGPKPGPACFPALEVPVPNPTKTRCNEHPPAGAPMIMLDHLAGTCYMWTELPPPGLMTMGFVGEGPDCPWRLGAGLDGTWPVRPSEFKSRLQAIGTLTYKGRTGEGSQATDAWSFRNTQAESWSTPAMTYTGTLAINVATGLVTRLQSSGDGTSSTGDRVIYWSDTTFSRYGTPVVSTRPTDQAGSWAYLLAPGATGTPGASGSASPAG
jgi:hypothetical protein